MIALHRHSSIARQAILVMACASATCAWADAPSFKFTTGSYNATGGDVPNVRGTDLNLRNTSSYGNTWLGWYKQDDIKQWRTGWDNSIAISSIRLQPSLQAASGGFWGGSFGVETGDTWYVGAGLGRTNLRPYVNLNFDPNDALMASGGYRWNTHQSIGLQWVRDNRLNPDQRNVHLVYRTGLAEHHRLTVDALSKAGSVTDSAGNTQRINKLGLSLTYDWHEYFVRAAYDPNANFSTQNMLRLSVGLKF
jgi:hypothetical protein